MSKTTAQMKCMSQISKIMSRNFNILRIKQTPILFYTKFQKF